MKKILVLEDEANIRSFVVINLNRAGYETIEAGSGEEALEQLRLNPDVGVALLDIMLPDMDGFEVCRRIRAGNSKIGIIMLTARTQEMDKVTGFMTGADDYVTKPFSPAELTARIDALYRRIGGDVSDDGVISQPPSSSTPAAVAWKSTASASSSPRWSMPSSSSSWKTPAKPWRGKRSCTWSGARAISAN